MSILNTQPSQPVAFAIAASIGAIAATTVIFGSLAIRRRIATDDLKASIPEISETHQAIQLTEFGAAARRKSSTVAAGASSEETRAAKVAARARRGEYDEALVLEQLARNRVFLGDEGLKKVRGAFVVVVGLGGVGSHAAAALARSGVEKIRVVDFDQVTLSSLNRHALATGADVGSPKVQVVRKRLEAIVPWVRVDARNELLKTESADRLLGDWNYELRSGEEDEDRKVDWVVDAIDNIDTKVELLKYCYDRGIKVISAMGAGIKSDPTRVMVSDISASFEDPLSSSTRRRLRILGIRDGIPVVFSSEKPGKGKAQLQPVAEKEVEKGDVGGLGVLPDFRVRILPVLGTMPAVFGYTAANHVLCSLAGYPMEYRVGDRGRDKMYDGILSSLQGTAERLVRGEGADSVGLRLPVSKDDVSYLVEEVFRGRSVVSGLSTRLALVPWKADGGFASLVSNEPGQKHMKLSIAGLVLMTKEEAQRHEKEVLGAKIDPEEYYDSAVVKVVGKRRKEEEYYSRYR
jgi:tRNA threonylcarbamoyladenosine dehydratase